MNSDKYNNLILYLESCINLIKQCENGDIVYLNKDIWLKQLKDIQNILIENY